MKLKLWMFQFPVILLFTFCFYVYSTGEQGKLSNHFLRETVYPSLKSINGTFTNFKFKIRGEQKPKNKVVIVSIDDLSLESIGRWPWSRDKQAALIQSVIMAGAKVVGLDLYSPEPQETVPQGLKEQLVEKGFSKLIDTYDADRIFAQTIQFFNQNLVLGFASGESCHPVYFDENSNQCPISNPDAIAYFPKDMEKFSIKDLSLPPNFNPHKTPLETIFIFTGNTDLFNQSAQHSAHVDAIIDPDGYIRSTTLIKLANKKAYSALPLKMAEIGLAEEISVKINQDHLIDSIKFKKSGRLIQSNPQGNMDINFRGGYMSFPYVKAVDLLTQSQNITVEQRGRTLASDTTAADVLKDAYVLIGLTALGAHDLRSFPFEANIPGVEGHATILDNILAGDMLSTATSGASLLIMYLLMIVGAFIIAYYTEKLKSIPALIMFITSYLAITLVDQKILFENNINWATSFFYLEMMFIFMFTVAAKYVLEEKDKQFIKGAFSKYVAKDVVDSLIKDPKKLSLGGEKKELTILFSDIRSFTTMSEKMDAKTLAKLLNEYLSSMTETLFENKGTLDKYIGDAIMAFWGAPMHQEDHAFNAITTAIKMQQILQQERPKFKKDYNVDLEVGIGLHTDLVNVGNMGSERNFNYTVIGDGVNLASRVEGLTKFYQASIITTTSTIESIRNSGKPVPQHRVIDLVKVKGKKNAVELVQIFTEEFSAEKLKAFNEARQYFNARKWEQAISAFNASGGKNDGPSLRYLERCEEFKQNPPPEDWDGSLEMRSK